MTLGAWIVADGNQHRQLEVLCEHSALWTKAVEHSSLTPQEKQIVYTAFLRIQLAYPLGCTTIADIDLKQIF